MDWILFQYLQLNFAKLLINYDSIEIIWITFGCLLTACNCSNLNKHDTLDENIKYWNWMQYIIVFYVEYQHFYIFLILPI